MIHRLAAAALAALAAGATVAQEPPSSADLLSAFVTRCAEASADPRAAVNAMADGDAGGTGGMTSDGAMAMITVPLPQATDDVQVIMFVHQVVVGGEARQSCSLSAYLASNDAPILADMADVVGAQAESILGGPAVRSGGPTFGGSLADGASLARMLVWSREEEAADGPVLTLVQDPRSLSLALNRVVPASRPAP